MKGIAEISLIIKFGLILVRNNSSFDANFSKLSIQGLICFLLCRISIESPSFFIFVPISVIPVFILMSPSDF
jgi:hypothetical protein